MKVYFIDDEISNREILEIMIHKYFPEYEIVGNAESVIEALEDIKLNETDLLFLDVMMPNKTGFDLLKELENYKFEVIFVSGYDEYAIKAFSYSAIDYILKPIDKDQLIAAVHRAENRVIERKQLAELLSDSSSKNRIIEVVSSNQVKFIDMNEVSYFIGSSGGYTDVYLKNKEKYAISKSLKMIEAEIEDLPNFLCVTKGIIINLLDIESYDRGSSGHIIMKTNHFDLFVSRRKKREVIQAIDLIRK